jgi:hypothetical protein
MIRLEKIIFFLIVILFIEQDCLSFQQTLVKGAVKDSTGFPVENVSVFIQSLNKGVYTDKNGSYSFTVPSYAKEYIITFSCIGYKTENRTFVCDKNELTLNIILHLSTGSIGEVSINPARNMLGATLVLIPIRDISLMPSASGSFETILKTMPGVSSNNELSSQYSVRGGNYDENLVYVNDVEIFRPFLIRSGQQEGLSFINPDLTSSVHFSSGGFSASYGDKMSSVLDITYKKPKSKKGSVSLGLLTSSAYLEGISKSGKLSWIAGVRYKSSRLMLKTLDSKGDYQPVFADIQSLISYKTGKNSSLSLLSTYSSNTYNYIPQSRTSTFGNEAQAYQLYVLFSGGEKDRYETWNSVLTWEFTGKKNIIHKLLFSAFSTNEKESFDIRGMYSLSNLDKESGSENFTDSIMNIGIGSWLSHARNKLSANILSAAYRGEKGWGEFRLSWGFRIRNDIFNDKIKEWTIVDSAGYSVPLSSNNLKVASLISAENNLNYSLIDSYIESEKTFQVGSHQIQVIAGLRGLYNSFTDETLLSPRISSRLKMSDKVALWLAGGLYFQQPFYREMRYPDGTLNRSIKSQKSFHTVVGMTYDFYAWARPFRLTTELYNKRLSNIIPYRLDNVRLTYAGENSAEGYSRGIDIRLNGEFVPGAESWVSFSIMDSRLRIPSLIEGKFPSPSDQTFGVNVFFQDYLPGNPTWRAHINIAFATGIPIISPYNDRYDQYHRLPSYRRVDIGFTKVIKSKNPTNPEKGNLKFFDEIVAGVEVFNLLDINNTISYLWIRTINNLSGQMRQFAVPNYLTGRSLNFKVSASF